MTVAKTSIPIAAYTPENAPVWLPNGYEILYRNNKGSTEETDVSQMYVVNIKTGQIRRVTRNESLVYFTAEISPDHSYFVFSRFSKDDQAFRGERADIYRLDLE